MIDSLQRIQRGLWGSYQVDQNIRDQVLNGCQDLKECELALYNPDKTFEAVVAQIRSAIHTKEQQSQNIHQFNTNLNLLGEEQSLDQNYLERKYRFQGSNRGNKNNFKLKHNYNGRIYSQDRGQSYRQNGARAGPESYKKKCFICGKPGCWSTHHSLEERKAGFSRFQQQSYFQGEPVTPEYYQAFLAEWEGVEGFTHIENEVDQFLESWENEFDEHEHKNEQFLTEYGPVNPYQVIQHLNNQSAFHAVTRKDIFKNFKDNKSSSFSPDLLNSAWQQDNTFLSRYSDFKFQGIIPDTGAAGVSTAGHPQLRALQKQMPSVQINKNRAGEHQIRFGKGEAISLGTVEINTPIGKIVFHVVPLHTPFLLCFQDMKQMGVYLNNLENVLVQGQKIVPIVIKFGHPFLLLDQTEESIAFSHLTETELRRLSTLR